MKILFFGTSDFGCHTLKALINSKHEILYVVTGPDKPKGRNRKKQKNKIKILAEQRGLNILQPDSLINNKEFIKKITLNNPDLFYVVGYKILPEVIFNIPKYGSINLHASLLPEYRGASPIHYALLNNNKTTGLTTFFINKKIDEGIIINQASCNIESKDNFGSLHDKLSLLGSKLSIKTIEQIANNSHETTKQDISAISYAPKIKKSDFQIDWKKSALSIHNKIRAFSPYPGAYTFLNQDKLKLFDSQVVSCTDIKDKKPGYIIIKQRKILVKSLDDYVEISFVQASGKNKVSVNDFLNGYRKKIDCFE